MGFLYGVALQWKLDLRNKEILMIYYMVPLLFFVFVGGIFSSINPIAYETLVQSMTIFGVTMGAILGTPIPLTEVFGSDIKKAYKVGGIPLWTAIVNNFISGFIHLSIMSVVIFILAPIIFDAKVPENIPLYFISLLVFIAVCLLVGTVLGLLVKSISKLTMTCQVIFLPSILLSGIMFPSDMLPKVLQIAGKVLPATWGYINMQCSNISDWNLWPLCLISIVCIGLISLLLRMKYKE